MYLDINMTAFHADVLEPLLKLAQSELGDKVKLPESTMAYLVDLPEPDALGHMTLMTAYEDGSRMELTMKKPVLQYCAYYLGLALCGAAQASH